MKTAEEILKEKGVSINVDGNEYLKYGLTLNKIKSAMEEYTSQALAELKAENEELKRQLETYKAMTGEKIPDVQTVTSTDMPIKPDKPTDEEIKVWTDKVQPDRGGYKSDYIFAAKACRDGLTPAKD